MNQIIKSSPNLKSILRVNTSENFHSFFVEEAIKNYTKNSSLGSVLALGASYVEAESLIKFPFKKIVLTGIIPADKKNTRSHQEGQKSFL